MAWTQIEKRRFGGGLPEDIIRLRRGRVSIAGNVAEQFQATRRTADSGRETVKLGLAVEPDTHKIQIVPDSISSFTFSTSYKGSGRAIATPTPVGMRKLALQPGDYKLIDRRQLIFELAR